MILYFNYIYTISCRHVPGSWSIDFDGNIPTFAGWVISPDVDIYVVASNEVEVRDTTCWLRRVGLDRVKGFLDGGLFAWATEGLPTDHISQISVLEADLEFRSGKKGTILDVRAPTEFANSHIDGAINIPAPDLRYRFGELDMDSEILLICSTGHRSMLAGSILQSQHFKMLYNVSGGMKGFSSAALAPACVMCSIPHGPKLLVSKVQGHISKIAGIEEM